MFLSRPESITECALHYVTQIYNKWITKSTPETVFNLETLLTGDFIKKNLWNLTYLSIKLYCILFFWVS